MDDATNLNRLHDIALPPTVPVWPLAPGWWLLIIALLATASVMAYRAWKHWQANAYRREALRELEAANDVTTISAILKRCALAVTSRTTVATKSGEQWLAWLSSCSPTAMSEEVRGLLVSGPYQPEPSTESVEMLRAYAARWIRSHRPPMSPSQSRTT